MPFIPHTEKDTKDMLDTIGVKNIEALFDEIPCDLFGNKLTSISSSMNEASITRLMQLRAKEDQYRLSFLGAGSYEHHIPAAVWDIVGRGEFMTAYTPYQAEASQGTLQVIYEYQTMMTSLTGLEVSNASLYDGASALSEAVLMAIRINHKANKAVIVPETLHPAYRETLEAIISQQNITIIKLPCDRKTGKSDFTQLTSEEKPAALIIPQTNFFGVIEDVDQLTDWAHENNILAIAVANPTALALLREPGQWGRAGADIACGEGQPLGVPISSGGPYFGYLTCRQTYVREMPGRIVGRTVDKTGKPGFTLTLQAREQHIRRGKAKSNICTNQGLAVTAATLYLSLLGPQGLAEVAQASHQNINKLTSALSKLGVETPFSSSVFHERVFRFKKPVKDILMKLSEEGILGGLALEPFYPELSNCILMCTTEVKTDEDIATLIDALKSIL